MAKTKARRRARKRVVPLSVVGLAKRANREKKLAPRAAALTAPDETRDSSGLPAHVQVAIVQALACYDTPQQVAELVKDEYGIEISRQGVQHYDPTRGEKPAEKWCELFQKTRDEFTAEASPISKRAVRLRRLNRMALAAEKMKNYALAASLTEQAAKDVGKVFTNRLKTEHTGKDGGPIEVKTDELRNKLTRRIAGVASRIGTHSNNSGSVPSGARSA